MMITIHMNGRDEMDELRQAIEQMTKEDIVALIEFVTANGSKDFIQSLLELLIAFELVYK